MTNARSWRLGDLVAEAKDPLRQLIDAVVYAPIGLVLLVRQEFPILVESGRTRVDNQITLARFIGKAAVRRGKAELIRRVEVAQAARRDSAEVVDGRLVDNRIVDASSVETVAPTTLPDAIIAAVIAIESESHPSVAEFSGSDDSPDSSSLPIEGYDSLAASQVVVRLATLTADELGLIRTYEETNRARRTILGKISQLQAR